MNIRSYLFALNFLLFFFIGSSQDYSKGYIIDLQGDTLFGQVDYRRWDKSPQKVDFKKDGKLNRYSVYQVQEFGVLNEQNLPTDIFRSKQVQLDISKKVADTNESEEPEFVETTIFLQTLLDGEMTLYKHESVYNKTHYFIEKGEEVPEELIQRIAYYFKEVSGLYEKHGFNVDYYKRVLAKKMEECPSVGYKVNLTAFKEGELIELIADYNEGCFKEGLITFRKSFARAKTTIYTSLGYVQSDLSFGGSTFNDLAFADFQPHTGGSFGLGLAYTLPKYDQKLSVLGYLSWQSFDINGSYEKITSSEQYYNKQYHFDLAYFYFNVGARYHLMKSKFTPLVEAYYLSGILTSLEQETFEEAVFFSSSRSDTYPILTENPKTYQKGWLIGVGFSYQNLKLIFRHGNSDGMAKALGSKFKINSVTLEYGFLSF